MGFPECSPAPRPPVSYQLLRCSSWKMPFSPPHHPQGDHLGPGGSKPLSTLTPASGFTKPMFSFLRH